MASRFEMPVWEMPDYVPNTPEALQIWREWLKPYGFGLEWYYAKYNDAPRGFSILVIRRNGLLHSVVCEDGELKHDPGFYLKSLEGIEKVHWFVITVLDPAKVRK